MAVSVGVLQWKGRKLSRNLDMIRARWVMLNGSPAPTYEPRQTCKGRQKEPKAPPGARAFVECLIQRLIESRLATYTNGSDRLRRLKIPCAREL